jgi:hypothetical protein
MARPKNIHATSELKIPTSDHLRLALTAFAKISGYTTPNGAAEALIREALEIRFGKLGDADFFRNTEMAIREYERGLSGLHESFNITPDETD